jgi:UDP-2-acetamido-3-amino-2,3-dideoxy-glucuronate N-acetyltransferase
VKDERSPGAIPAAKVRVGLVGLGYWGKNILRNFAEMGVLEVACDADSATVRDKQSQYPVVRFTESVEDVLTDRNVGAVAIATPAFSHYDLALRALSAGKDVFVEKPLAATSAQAEELVELARRKKRVLMVGHILQYHPAVIKLKELIGQGKLGRIQYVYSNRLNIGKLRVEEDILWSFAPHDISVILALVGGEPTRVSCFGGAYLSRGVYDVTSTTLEFPNDVKAHVFVSWLHPFKEQKLVVVGSEAMAVFDDLTKEKLFIYPHRVEWKEGRIPVAHKAEYHVVDVGPGEPLREELSHFIDCVANRSVPATDGAEGLRVIRVLEQARDACAASAPKPAPTDYIAHPTAIVDESVVIGAGTRIWHYSHVLKDTRIGRNCVLGQNVMVGPAVTIGDGCKIQNNVSLYRGVTLEDKVFCGPSCVFTNVYNPRAFVERKSEFLPTLVREGASIGANATVVCGTTIGRYAFVGAGAVVKKDVADYALVVGVPARRIGWVCRCGVTLRGRKPGAVMKCEACGSSYRERQGVLAVVKETL